MTLANQLFTKLPRQAEDHATGFHHEVMELEVAAEMEDEAEHERLVGRNLAAMTDKTVENAEKLWTEPAKERAHLHAECTEDKVQQEAAWCQREMSSDLDTVANKFRICN